MLFFHVAIYINIPKTKTTTYLGL